MLNFFKSNKKPSKEDVYNFLDTESYTNKYGNGFYSQDDVIRYCKEKGVENVRFLAPLKNIYGLAKSDEKKVPDGVFYEEREGYEGTYYVECGINEGRYLHKLEDEYKLELYAIGAEEFFASDSMYVMDLGTLVRCGVIKIIVSKKE